MINLELDLSALIGLVNAERVGQRVMREAARDLSIQVHAHIVEEVSNGPNKLNSSRDDYLQNLEIQQIDEDTWSIHLDGSAMWIEEGRKSGEMIDDLLRSPKAKMSASGHRYLVVPFKHNKGPSRMAGYAKDLQAAIKAEMKQRGIQYGGIEKNSDGSPKLGTLHKFSVSGPDHPIKPHGPIKSAGMGMGMPGQPRQGLTGTPHLSNVSVVQKMVNGRAIKGIMTFRVVSDKQKGSGAWVHPGLAPKRFFDEAYKFAEDLWETTIAPQLLEKFYSGL